MFDAKKLLKEAQEFLEVLFPSELPGYICTWEKSTKKSQWHGEPDTAAIAVAGKQDVYVCVNKGIKNAGPVRRVTKSTASGMAAIWMDIDVATGEHQKTNLPPTIDDALKLVMNPLRPSIILKTGGGLHVYWLLKEPVPFNDDDTRLRMASLVQAWQTFIRNQALQHGWTLDSTHDLARLMRIPGTFNAKRKPVLVTTHYLNRELMYDEPVFDPYIREVIQQIKRDRTLVAKVGEFTINPDRFPPVQKFHALCAADKKFERTFNRTRKDTKNWSPSEYDLSLANVAALAEWSDQEIVDLMIASRVKAGDPTHHDHKKKYEITVAKARAYAATLISHDAIDAAIVTGESKDVDNRDKFHGHLSQIFNVEIRGVIKYLTDPPEYLLRTTHGDIVLGGVDGLITQSKFRSHIAGVSGILVPTFKPVIWAKHAQLLLDVCEEISVGDEATDIGLTRGWMEDYFSEIPPNMIEDDLEHSISMRRPLVREDKIHFFATGGVSSFREWLRTNRGENLTAKKIGTLLRRAGARPRVIRLNESTQRLWVLDMELSLIYMKKITTARFASVDKND